jgi:hypothetical protein
MMALLQGDVQPMEGDHAYEKPVGPVTARVTDVPKQTAAGVAVTENATGIINTFSQMLCTQPTTSV